MGAYINLRFLFDIICVTILPNPFPFLLGLSARSLPLMSLKSLLVSIPFLWRGATALPAGPGSWTHGNSTIIPAASDDFNIEAAYNLIDTYDASNWASKFNFENIADPTRMYPTTCCPVVFGLSFF